jgi:hypothetical protein
MRIALVGSVLVALLLLGGCSKLECESPDECGGNPCCWSFNVEPGSERTSCSAEPDGCVPDFGIDSGATRTCRTDGDCSRGGISTEAIHCCPVSDQNFRVCVERTCS